jgi:hypothetical protein
MRDRKTNESDATRQVFAPVAGAQVVHHADMSFAYVPLERYIYISLPALVYIGLSW